MKALVIGQGKSGTAAAAALRTRGAAVEFADGLDLVVASPGVRVVSELAYGCAELKRCGWRLVAVTGSKGKSSVVKLIADALGGTPCGNYGLPVTALIGREPGWAIVEVSSFMLETTVLPGDTFEAAAILNLQSDHLDRHGTLDVYHALKRRLLTMAKVGVEPCVDVSAADRALFAGSYFDNAVLCANASAAIALLRAVRLGDAAIAAAFKRFEPLPHRFADVGTFGGVRCIDDSKATSLAALAAGVRMCKGAPVRLIAGGKAKGDDPKAATTALTCGVKKVYLIGQCAETFSSAWRGAVDCAVCGDLETAVKEAMREARPGEILLLSPGTASFDQFNSFEERGERFADLVKKEGKDK